MKIDNGYKMTEVGVIPEDWDVVLLPQIIWFQEGPGLRKWQFKNEGIKVLNITNLQDNGILDLSKTDRYVSIQECENMYKHFLIDENDFVMASSGNSYCKTSIVRKVDLPLLMNTSVIRFKPKQQIGYSFMVEYLKSKYFKMQIDLLVTGGAQPNFGPAHLNKVLVIVPPTIEEQKAIATALSDADELIQSLEKLIAKKRAIKQGAMQELIKHKEGWVAMKLGDIGTFSKGAAIKRDESNSGDLPCVRYGEIYTLHNNYIKKYYSFISLEIAKKSKRIKKGDLLFAGSGETKEDIGKCVAYIGDDEVYAGGDIVILSPKKINSLFFGYYLNTPEIIKQKASKGQGDAIVHIGANSLQEILINIPENYEEQTAIASTLSDMDLEITTLEAKMEKYKKIKQGMMQNLLTGKIRLV